MTYTADGTVSRKLLDTLGLPAGTDVVEWQTWGVAEPASTDTPVVQTVTAYNPMIYWRLGESAGATTAVDSAGGDNPGTYSGTVTRGTAGLVPTDTDTAATFAGGQVRTDTRPPVVNYFTWCALIKPSSLAAECRFAFHGETVNSEYWSIGQFSGGRLYTFVRNQSLNSGQFLATPSAVLSVGTVHHIAVSFDGTAQRLFVDGVQVASLALSGTLPQGTQHLFIGRNSSAAYPYQGVMDEAAFYPTALSETQIADIAGVALSGESSTPPPAESWILDEDRTDGLIAYQTQHGRPSPLDNTGPLTCTVNLARERLTDPIPTVGERFRLALSEAVGTALAVDPVEWPRFTGEITDVEVLDGTQTPGNPSLTIVQVTAVGRSARLGKVPIGGTRPAELDGERVRRALYKAAIYLPLDLGTFDPGTVTLLAADWRTGGHNAKEVVDQVTQDSLGQLVEHRSGRLDWHDAEHRRDRASLVTLDGGAHIIRPFRWTQAIGTVVNIAEVEYGDAETAEGRDTVKITDPRSADVATGLGPYGVQIDSQLQDRDDAQGLASTIVGRYADPAWMLPDLAVDVVRTAGAQAGEVLALTHGDKITASGLPPDGPFTAGDLFVEGTTETFTRTAWRVSLSVADPRIAGVGVRWVDLDLETDQTWSGVDPAMTWLDAATAAPADF